VAGLPESLLLKLSDASINAGIVRIRFDETPLNFARYLIKLIQSILLLSGESERNPATLLNRGRNFQKSFSL